MLSIWTFFFLVCTVVHRVSWVNSDSILKQHDKAIVIWKINCIKLFKINKQIAYQSKIKRRWKKNILEEKHIFCFLGFYSFLNYCIFIMIILGQLKHFLARLFNLYLFYHITWLKMQTSQVTGDSRSHSGDQVCINTLWIHYSLSFLLWLWEKNIEKPCSAKCMIQNHVFLLEI